MIIAKLNTWKWGATLSLAALLGMTGQSAQAALDIDPVITTSKVDAAAPAGTLAVPSQAFPSFIFTFDSSFDLANFEVMIKYDPSKLSFMAAASSLSATNAGTVTIPATPVPALLQAMQTASPDFQYSAGFPAVPTDEFTYSFTGSYFNPGNFASIAAGTSITLSTVFQMLPGFDSGSTGVQVFGNAGDRFFASAPFDVTASVTAVPEPEAWLMLLGGLGLIAARVQRRKSR